MADVTEGSESGFLGRVDGGAHVSQSALVWDLAYVRNGSTIGAETIIGRGVYVGPGAKIGERCKIQNFAQIYEPAVLHDGVFIGPGVVLTNDMYPRSINPDGTLKTADDWQAVGVEIGEGAAIGARSVCVAPISIGKWAMVGAGSVVVDDVPDFALVVGTPARQIGWVGRSGRRLEAGSAVNEFKCPISGETYLLTDGVLTPSSI